MLNTQRLMRLIDEYAELKADPGKNDIARRKKEEIQREIRSIEMNYTRMENQLRKARILFPL